MQWQVWTAFGIMMGTVRPLHCSFRRLLKANFEFAHRFRISSFFKCRILLISSA